MTKTFLFKTIEPNCYTKTSSFNIYILTHKSIHKYSKDIVLQRSLIQVQQPSTGSNCKLIQYALLNLTTGDKQYEVVIINPNNYRGGI